MSFLLVLAVLPSAIPAINVNITNGVPDDISAIHGFLPTSADFGLYSQCELPRGSGQLSGICVPASYVAANMSFCGEVVKYAACVPPSNPIWPDWNTTAKDALIESVFTSLVSERMVKEELSLAKNGSSEEYLQMRFTGNQGCIDDFKKILCYYNFPECEYLGSTGKSTSPVVHLNTVVGGSSTADISSQISSIYPMCYERCTDYFNQCKFPSTMVTEFCQSNKTLWPLLAADIGSLSVSPMVKESVSNCTGKNAEISTRASIPSIVVLILVVITDMI